MNINKSKILFIIILIISFNSSLNAKTVNETEATTVYVTKSGSCYHKINCPTLSRSKKVVPISKEMAKSKGYKACSKCKV